MGKNSRKGYWRLCFCSLGITPELSTAVKVVIMTLMFIGKNGMFTFLFSMGGKPLKHAYHYPKERIIIG
ncbi:hypothetical protein MRBLBA21_002864 [Peribacillus frigoritolerans]|jgi:Trk-type K+ transport system membrane component|uniref:hypothetical protein n=1 Tax=Peribacillus frigoritolerans TaxID=450367 RepID=UPI001145CB87|nr:hypothetical protein [Peribacillus frigoritolerans]MBD8135986.1 hypothetical protein [Bacillus sp. CFBP 13597]